MNQQLAARRPKAQKPRHRGLALPSPRVISFEEARAQFVHRFTMEHVPAWANSPHHEARGPLDTRTTKGPFYAPQYRTDREWYDNTAFPGEDGLSRHDTHCYSINQSWPLGQSLQKRYVRP